MGPIVGGPMTYFASKRVDLRHLTRLRARRRESYLLPDDGSRGDGTRPGGRGILFYMATAGFLPILSRHRPGNR